MMAGVGEHKDAWGNTTEGCEAMIDHRNHGTWTLCGNPAVCAGIYGDGSARRLCASHRSGALRTRTFWQNSITALLTMDGEVTHELVRGSGRKGQLRARVGV